MRPNQFSFVPSVNSTFSDRKKVPPGCNVQNNVNCPSFPPDWQGRIQLMTQAKASEDFRQQLLNSHQLNSPFPVLNSQTTSHEGNREILKLKRGNDYKPIHEKVNDLNSTLSTSFSSCSSSFLSKNPLTTVQPFNLSFAYRPKKVVPSEPAFKFVPRKVPHNDEPFKPVLGNNQPTKPAQFTLSTQCRAEKRDIFEERVKMNLRNREAEALMKRQMEEEKERENIKRIRKQMEFKALPLPPGVAVRDRNDIRNHPGLWNLNRCNMKK